MIRRCIYETDCLRSERDSVAFERRFNILHELWEVRLQSACGIAFFYTLYYMMAMSILLRDGSVLRM